MKSRAIGCFLALAVNQKQPNIALEIIQQLNLKNYSIVIQSIRLQAFAEIERFHDAIDILRYQLKKDRAVNRNKVVFQETVSLLLDWKIYLDWLILSTLLVETNWTENYWQRQEGGNSRICQFV